MGGNSWLVTIGAVLVTGLLAYQTAYDRAIEDRKLAVLDAVSGHRYLVHQQYACISMDPLLEALNRAIITYAEHPEVVKTIVSIQDASDREGAQDRMDNAIVQMATAIGIEPPELDFEGDLPGLIVDPVCPVSRSPETATLDICKGRVAEEFRPAVFPIGPRIQWLGPNAWRFSSRVTTPDMQRQRRFSCTVQRQAGQFGIAEFRWSDPS